MDIKVRPMTVSDLPSMMTLQTLCFPELEPESETSLKAKLVASPSTCFVAEAEHQLMGYIITHPWISHLPPELNSAYCDIPSDADCLYIHDLSVHPDARGTGTSTALLNQFFMQCKKHTYKLSALIAVQNSKGFWMKHGYSIKDPNERIKEKLASYGADAHYMMRKI